MIINILAGGPDELLPDLNQYDKKGSIWVGVDRGVFRLLSRGIEPYMAFGDFDSVTKEEWHSIQQKVKNIEKFIPEKDETDTELALSWAISQETKLIRLFGGTGGRLDHFLANIQLLLKYIHIEDCTIEIIDRKNTLYAKKAGCHFIEKERNKKYISFVSATNEVKGLTLNGFKFPLKDCHISLGSTLCISNELINDHGTFSFSEGILIVVRSQD